MQARSLHYPLIIITASLLPTYLIRFSAFGIPTNILEVLIASAFVLGIVDPSIRRRWMTVAHAFPRTLAILIGLFLLSAVISTIISPHLYTSLGILKGWILFPLLYAFMLYAAASQKLEIRKWKLEITDVVIQALTFSALVVALLGISQIGTLDRVHGPFDVPNSLALFLAPIIVLAVFRLPATPYKLQAVAIMSIALIATQSVMGVFSVIVALTVGVVVFKSTSKRVFLLALLALVVISGFVLREKLTYLTAPQSSAAARLQLWDISWELIKEQPLLGIGLGTFEPAYQEKLHGRFTHYNLQPETYNRRIPLPEFVFRDPHNWILSLWLNMGILGLIAFAGIHFLVFRWVVISARNQKTENRNQVQIAAAFALLTLLIFGLTDTIYWKNDLSVLHWVLIALLAKANHSHSNIRCWNV